MYSREYATITKRAISFTIDDLLVSFLFIIIYYNNIVELNSQESMVSFILENSWVLLLLKVIYHTFFIAYSGATIGKYFMKIRAINEESGENLSWSSALIRALVRVLGESLFYFTFLFAFIDKRRQTLHDKIAKCVVIDA